MRTDRLIDDARLKVLSALAQYAKICSVLFFCIVLGYLLACILWNLIVLPFNNPYKAVGKLALAEFNPLNNYVRWLIFILLPSFIFILLLKFRVISQIFHTIFKTIDKDLLEINVNTHKTSLYTLINKLFKAQLFLYALTLVYLFLTRSWSTSAFDMFHEGEQLTPALNYTLGKGVWTGTLFVHGALYDLFTAILGWKLLNSQSIGAYRISVMLLNLIKDLSLILLLYTVYKNLSKSTANEKFALTLSSLMLTFYLLTIRVHNVDRRMLPIILLLCCLLSTNTDKIRARYYIAGIISVLGIFYSLDSGIYGIIIVLAHVLTSKLFEVFNLKSAVTNLLFYTLGLATTVLGFYKIFGETELIQLIKDFIYFLKVKDLLDSYIYPFPDLLLNPRSTIPISLIAINILVFTVFLKFLYLQSDHLKSLAVTHATLLITSLVLYRNALGRSDLLHIEASSSFIYIVLGFSLGLILLFLRDLNRFVKHILILSFSLNSAFIIFTLFRSDHANLITFPTRITDFVNTCDTHFVNSEKLTGILRLREIFSEQECVMNLTSEAVMPYLLSKPSCGRVYISYFASAEPVRGELFDTLIKTTPKYILYDSKSWTQNLDNITNEQRFPNVMKYVHNNYEPFETVSNYWTVYALKKGDSNTNK